jgi:hypothetical protein
MITHTTSTNPGPGPDSSIFKAATAKPQSAQAHDYIQDVSTVSQNFSALSDKLAKLQQSDPARFQQVQQAITQKLTAAADDSTGFRASLLQNLASAFQGSAGTAPSITVSNTGQGAANIQATADSLLTHIFDAVNQIPTH